MTGKPVLHTLFFDILARNKRKEVFCQTMSSFRHEKSFSSACCSSGTQVPFFFMVWSDQIARFCIGPNGKSSDLITPDHEKERHHRFPFRRQLVESLLDTMRLTGADFTRVFRGLSLMRMPGARDFSVSRERLQRHLVRSCCGLAKLRALYTRIEHPTPT